MGTLQIIKTGISAVAKGKAPFFKGKAANKDFGTVLELKNTGTAADEFVRTTSNPPRKLTSIDAYNFRQYLFSKKFDLKITPEELKTLYSYEGEDFKLQSFEFLCKKLNIPKDLKPNFEYGKDAATPMLYDFVTNTIKINPDFAQQLSDKTIFLSTLRHEMQHFLQNMSMFRHETKGQELITFYSKLYSNKARTNLDNFAKNYDTEQLRHIFDEAGMKDMIYLKELLKNNKTQEYEQFLTKTENDLCNQLIGLYTDMRENIIKNMGIIKKETVEGRRAERMFNETASEFNYWQADGSINIGKYFTDMREIEAVTAQDIMSLRLNAVISGNDKFCYVKSMRESQELMKKNIEQLDPQLQELIKESQKKDVPVEDMKELLSYLFG